MILKLDLKDMEPLTMRALHSSCLNTLDMATLDVIAGTPGKSVAVPYQDHEPIFYLIQRISRKLGEKDSEFWSRKLYMNGTLLTDHEDSIARYRIFGTVLTYRATRTSMMVYIDSFTGKTFSVECSDQTTEEELRELIQDAEGIPKDEQRLMFAGKHLEDKSCLKDHRIIKGSTIQMTLRLRGGHSFHITPGVVFADISDTEGVIKVPFSTTAPPGRIASSGTNVECQCACTPDYRVICQRGVGTIELSDTSFTCPNCSKSDRIAPVTVGFVKCKYRFHGVKVTGERYTSEWKNVKKEDFYQLYGPTKQIGWRRLVIESDKLDAHDKCTVCLKPVVDNSTNLSCGHRFHTLCFIPWKTCLICNLNKGLRMRT